MRRNSEIINNIAFFFQAQLSVQSVPDHHPPTKQAKGQSHWAATHHRLSMVCLFCTMWAQPSLPTNVKCALQDIMQHCSPEVWYEHVRDTFFQDTVVDVATCVKFLENLYATLCYCN